MFLAAFSALISICTFGQVPQGMYYQTQIYQNNGTTPVPSGTNVTLVISIYSGTDTIYQESFVEVTQGSTGIVTVTIGTGTPIGCTDCIDFIEIPWNTPWSMNTHATGMYCGTPFPGCTPTIPFTYNVSGSFLSVPYAFYAENCGDPLHYVGEIVVEDGDSAVIAEMFDNGHSALLLSLSTSPTVLSISDANTLVAASPGWSLPSIDQWKAIMKNTFIINESIVPYGGDAVFSDINLTPYIKYWTSTLQPQAYNTNYVVDGVINPKFECSFCTSVTTAKARLVKVVTY